MRVVYLDFVWCCAVALVLVLIVPRIPLAIGPDLRASGWLQALLGAYLVVTTPIWILPGFISAAGDYKEFARLGNLDIGLQAVSTVGACLILGPSYVHVIAALTLEQAVMIGVYLWFLRRYRQQAPSTPVSLRETLTYGLRLQWGVLMKLLSSRADVLTVGALTSSAMAGLYSVALNIRDIGLLPLSVYVAPFQNLVIDRARGGTTSDRSPIITGLLLQFGLSVALALVAAVALPILIPLVYGEAFRPAAGAAVILFSSIIFLGPAGLCWVTFNAKGRPHLTSLLLTAGGILGPALTYIILVTGHGLVGAATGTVVVAAFTLGSAIVLLQRLQGYSRRDLREGLVRAVTISKLAVSHLRSDMHRIIRREA
jgi:O-antigen/teichoic acid export membrane protein